MKRFLTMLVIWAGMLTCATAAHAASLVYLDSDGDVTTARPDGSGVHKLVSNGFSKGPISVDGSGRIGYFYSSGGSPFHELIDKDGKHLAGPFLFGNMGLCGYIDPFRSASSPDGTWIAATYYHGNACDTAVFTLKTRLIAADGPTLDDSVYGSYSGLIEPRFLPQDQALLSGIIDNQINIWQGPQTPTMIPWIGLPDPNWDIDSFDYDPSRNRMIMEQSPAGNPTGGERKDFMVLDFDAPAGSLNPVCTRDGLVASSTGRARPRYSPDGSQIAWTGPAGIYVSPAPTNAGGTCTLSPKLVVKGGSEVNWSPANLNGGSSGSDSLRVIAVGGATRAGFRSGMAVRIAAPTAGTIRVVATVPKATAKSLKLARRPRAAVQVASGSRSAPGVGTVTVNLRPTAKAKRAWKKLAGVRVTLKVAQGSRSATRTVKIGR